MATIDFYDVQVQGYSNDGIRASVNISFANDNTVQLDPVQVANALKSYISSIPGITNISGWSNTKSGTQIF